MPDHCLFVSDDVMEPGQDSSGHYIHSAAQSALWIDWGRDEDKWLPC